MAKGLSNIIINCDEVLKKITNKDQVAVTELMKLLWVYIREHNLKVKKG